MTGSGRNKPFIIQARVEVNDGLHPLELLFEIVLIDDCDCGYVISTDVYSAIVCQISKRCRTLGGDSTGCSRGKVLVRCGLEVSAWRGIFLNCIQG